MLNILFVILICDISFDVFWRLIEKVELATLSRNIGKKWQTLGKTLTLKKYQKCKKFNKNMLKLIKELK
jgi:hypothetical protein